MRWIWVIALVLWCAPAWGATYYIDATSGNDAAAGTAEGTAWKTVAKVNATSFSGDDIISFKKGETWHETLVVPSSGTDGHPITFNSYGSGTDPVISGAIDGSTFAVGAPSEIIVNGGAESALDAEWSASNLTVTQDGTDQHSGTYSLKCVFVSNPARLNQTVALEANTYYQFQFWQKKTAGADGGVLVSSPNATWLQSDLSSWGDAAFLYGVIVTSADWTQHSIVFKSTSAGNYTFRWQWAAAATGWLDDVSVKKVQWEQVSGNEYKANAYQSLTMHATKSMFNDNDVANQGGIYYNGSLLTIGTATSLNANEAGWDDTNKTWNVNVGASPSGLDIQIPWRGTNIHANGQDYITIDGLDLRYTGKDDGTNLTGAIHAEDSASTNWTVQNCTIKNHWSAGINGSATGHTGWTITGNEIENIWNGRVYGANGTGTGIRVPQGGSNTVASKNYIKNVYVGIQLEGGDSQASYNILNGIYVNGIDHQIDTSANPVVIYNNSIYHTPPATWVGGHGISCQSAGHGAKIKNNIIYSNAGAGATNAQAFALSQSNTIQTDNNIIFAAGASGLAKLEYTGEIAATTYTVFATYQTALDGLKSNATTAWTSDGTLGNAADANSISADPVFTNIAGEIFKLSQTSPAIYTGTDVSLTSDFDGKPIRNSTTPNIGAYESWPGIF